jgi:hypothetical protein
VHQRCWQRRVGTTKYNTTNETQQNSTQQHATQQAATHPNTAKCNTRKYNTAEHIGGTNMDEKDMPDSFQALPGAKTAFKHRNMMVLMVKSQDRTQNFAKPKIS